MNDMDRSRDELQIEMFEHFQRIRELESCLKAKGTEPHPLEADEAEPDWLLWSGLIDAIPSAVALVRANGKVAMVNRRWQEIYSFSQPGLHLAEHIQRMDPRKPDGTPYARPELPGIRALVQGEVVRNQEMLIYRCDGTALPVLVSSAPLFDARGKVAAAVIVFDDIVEYKQMQQTLAESQKDLERQTFLLHFTEALRPVEDAVEIQNRATRMLGEFLKVERALYGELEEDGDHFLVRRDYHQPGLDSFAGRYDLSAAAPALIQQLREGRTNVVQNVFTEYPLTERERDVYTRRELTAFVMVPLVKAGRMVAFLRVQSRAPREWNASDIALVEEVAERTWAAVERALAQEVVKDSERTYRSILDNSRDGILLLDLVTERYRYISPSHAENTGFSLEELYSFTLADGVARVHPDDLVLTMAEYKSPGHEPDLTDELEYRWKVKSGEYRWFRDRRKFILNEQGQPVAMVAVSRDVTKRKHDERQIAFQAHLLEKVHDAIIATDQNYRITYWNETAEKIFLLTADETVGRPVNALLRTLDREAGSFDSILSMARQDNFSGELLYHRKDGRTLHVDVQTSVIRDAQGRLQETISSVRDITARKEAEIHLRESEQRAKALVEKLQESDRNKSHFLSTLSHELRNPLAAIVMSISLLEHAGGNRQMKRHAEDVLKRQTDQLTRLVDDLLNITRINENKITLQIEPVELIGLIRRVMADFASQFAEKGVILTAELPQDPVILPADPARLTQVVGNLLHNALKFTKQDDRAFVSVSRDDADRMVEITVGDTGAGMEPEILQNIFQPFTQADRTLARTQGGLGLGLSIVKAMVELHGGSVTAESAGPGKGSRFIVRLPL